MAQIKIFSKPNMSQDITVSGLKILKPPVGWKFEVDVEFDAKIIKSIEKDTMLISEMQAAAGKVYEQTCASIKGKFSAFEKLFNGILDHGKLDDIKRIPENIKGFNQSLEQDKKIGQIGATQAVEAVWKKWAAKKSEYKMYKIKIAVTVFGAVAGLAISIGMTAAGGFSGGASAVIGIVGMIKSVVTIGKEIASAAIEIEKSQKMLDKYMKAVEVIAKKGKAAAKGNEYSAALVKQFLGEAQPNIKGCGSQLETIEKKLIGVKVKMHDCGKKLNGVLDKQEELRASFMKDVKTKLGTVPGTRAATEIKQIEAKLDVYLHASCVKVMEFIGYTSDLYQRVLAATETTEALSKRVQPLMALRGLDNTILENILYFVDMPLAAINGNAIATKSADLVSGLLPVAASMAYDKLTGAVLDKTLLA